MGLFKVQKGIVIVPMEVINVGPDQKRNLRIQELTRMALRGATLEELKNRAMQMASKKTAMEYVDEVVRRVS